MPLLRTPGASIEYVRAGSGGPAIIFVHGAFCSYDDWRAVMAALSHQHLVAALNLRGHGGSRAMSESCTVLTFARDVARLREELGVGQAILVGHSMACRVVLQAAFDAPAHTVGVVVVDGAIARLTRREALQREAARFSGDFRPGTTARFEEMLDEVPGKDRERILAAVRTVPARVARAVIGSSLRWDAESADTVLAELAVPVLAIQTTTVDEGPRRSLAAGESTDWLRLLDRRIGQLTTVRMTGLGHFPMLQAPAQCASAIEEFARDCAAVQSLR